jgi:hypothetical protein
LERHARADPNITVWTQDMSGADRYTSPKHEGIVLTLAEIEARPEPRDGLCIIVRYVEANPAARQPGERF